MTTNIDINVLTQQLRGGATINMSLAMLVQNSEILALCDALEAAQERIADLEQQKQQWVGWAEQLGTEADTEQKRMAELEASQLASLDAMPMQTIIVDEYGTYRFKANAIVSKLQEVAALAGYDLNAACRDNYSDEDWMQLAQLIGYSITGYSELSYVSDESYSRALSAAPTLPDSNNKKKLKTICTNCTDYMAGGCSVCEKYE